MINLLDVVETWATSKGLWSWQSDRPDPSNGKRFINLSRSKPPFNDLTYVSLYENGEFCPWDGEGDRKFLVPADPNFFNTLEALLSKT